MFLLQLLFILAAPSVSPLIYSSAKLSNEMTIQQIIHDHRFNLNHTQFLHQSTNKEKNIDIIIRTLMIDLYNKRGISGDQENLDLINNCIGVS